MDRQQLQELIMKKYQDEERTMVHFFVEWCREHNYDPHSIYKMAYPNQPENPILSEIMATLNGQEPLHIPDNTLLEVLQVFGNDELTFVIADLVEKSTKQ